MRSFVYVRKFSRVYALQMIDERRNLVRAFDPNSWMENLNESTGILHWPVWIVAAMLKTAGSPGALWSTSDGALHIGTVAGPGMVPLDWWIVRTTQENIETVSAETFAKTFEEVTERATV